MSSEKKIKYYSPTEEMINIYSHVVGLILSILALVFLVIHASALGNVLHLVSFSVFGVSLVVLYGASVLYHSAKEPALRRRLRVFDHISIYILIAGSYTPFTLVTLKGETGWILFGVAWGIALSGIILKLFFTGKYKVVSTSMYLALGWMVMFAIKPLLENLSADGVFWLVAGGLAYTVGAILYAIPKIKFNHAIFHLFVLMGSFSHYMAVYFYVLPHQ